MNFTDPVDPEKTETIGIALDSQEAQLQRSYPKSDKSSKTQKGSQSIDQETSLHFRVNVVLGSEMHRWLVSIAAKRGKTMADIIRDALYLEKWIDDAVLQEGIIYLERPDGNGQKIREKLILR